MSRKRNEAPLLPTVSLLITESDDEFEAIRGALDRELKPNGIIEQMYVGDIAQLNWEIIRFRRCKVALINSRMRSALEEIIPELMRKPGEYAHQHKEEADQLAEDWFGDPKSKDAVAEMLANCGLDESAIEAQAISPLIAEIEQIDRLLASLEARRNKALRSVSDYRVGFGRLLREHSDGILDGKVLALERPTGRKPAAA
jgi:hypothetical protein